MAVAVSVNGGLSISAGSSGGLHQSMKKVVSFESKQQALSIDAGGSYWQVVSCDVDRWQW